jgi:hypothetical protein
MIVRTMATEKYGAAVDEHARENADAVVLADREKADASAAHNILRTIAEDREVEDAILRDERAAADKTVRREHDASVRMLTVLLLLVRDATEHYLLAERARSDGALATWSDFLGMFSHYLRDLLNEVVMSSQFLAQKLEIHSDREKLLLETARI